MLTLLDPQLKMQLVCRAVLDVPAHLTLTHFDLSMQT